VGKEARGVLLVESIAIQRGASFLSEDSNVFNLGGPVFQVATGFEVTAGLEIQDSELESCNRCPSARRVFSHRQLPGPN
jgi:hypothetical protein